jgi:hypothetical protein
LVRKFNIDLLDFCKAPKNVGTKPGSVIPGGKSIIHILKLKSGTITEIPQ